MCRSATTPPGGGAKERPLAARLQALRGEASNAALGGDFAAFACWRVFRSRLSDLLAPYHHGAPMTQDIHGLVDEMDEPNLKVPLGCHFRLNNMLEY